MAVARHAVERRTLGGRPRLRVIAGGRSANPSKRKKKKRNSSPKTKASVGTTFFAVLAVAVCVFGLVLLNIYLAQASFRLADLQSRVVAEEAKHRSMRLKVAGSESPEKVAAAAGALGLVVPQQQEYIEGRSEEVQMAKVQPREPDGLKAVLGRNP